MATVIDDDEPDSRESSPKKHPFQHMRRISQPFEQPKNVLAHQRQASVHKRRISGFHGQAPVGGMLGGQHHMRNDSKHIRQESHHDAGELLSQLSALGINHSDFEASDDDEAGPAIFHNPNANGSHQRRPSHLRQRSFDWINQNGLPANKGAQQPSPMMRKASQFRSSLNQMETNQVAQSKIAMFQSMINNADNTEFESKRGPHVGKPRGHQRRLSQLVPQPDASQVTHKRVMTSEGLAAVLDAGGGNPTAARNRRPGSNMEALAAAGVLQNIVAQLPQDDAAPPAGGQKHERRISRFSQMAGGTNWNDLASGAAAPAATAPPSAPGKKGHQRRLSQLVEQPDAHEGTHKRVPTSQGMAAVLEDDNTKGTVHRKPGSNMEALAASGVLNSIMATLPSEDGDGYADAMRQEPQAHNRQHSRRESNLQSMAGNWSQNMFQDEDSDDDTDDAAPKRKGHQRRLSALVEQPDAHEGTHKRVPTSQGMAAVLEGDVTKPAATNRRPGSNMEALAKAGVLNNIVANLPQVDESDGYADAMRTELGGGRGHQRVGSIVTGAGRVHQRKGSHFAGRAGGIALGIQRTIDQHPADEDDEADEGSDDVDLDFWDAYGEEAERQRMSGGKKRGHQRRLSQLVEQPDASKGSHKRVPTSQGMAAVLEGDVQKSFTRANRRPGSNMEALAASGALQGIVAQLPQSDAAAPAAPSAGPKKHGRKLSHFANRAGGGSDMWQKALAGNPMAQYRKIIDEEEEDDSSEAEDTPAFAHGRNASNMADMAGVNALAQFFDADDDTPAPAKRGHQRRLSQLVEQPDASTGAHRRVPTSQGMAAVLEGDTKKSVARMNRRPGSNMEALAAGGLLDNIVAQLPQDDAPAPGPAGPKKHGRKVSHFAARAGGGFMGMVPTAAHPLQEDQPTESAGPKRGHARKMSQLVEQPDAHEGAHRRVATSQGMAAVLDDDTSKKVVHKKPGSNMEALAQAGVLKDIMAAMPGMNENDGYADAMMDELRNDPAFAGGDFTFMDDDDDPSPAPKHKHQRVGSIVTRQHGRTQSRTGDLSFASLLKKQTGEDIEDIFGGDDDDGQETPKARPRHGRKMSMLVEQPDAMKAAGHRRVMTSEGPAAVLDDDGSVPVTRKKKRPGSNMEELAAAGLLDGIANATMDSIHETSGPPTKRGHQRVGSIVTDTRAGHGRKDSHFGDRSFTSILQQAKETGTAQPGNSGDRDSGAAPKKRGHGRKMSMLVEQPNAMQGSHKRVMTSEGLAAVLDDDTSKSVAKKKKRPGSNMEELAAAGLLDALRDATLDDIAETSAPPARRAHQRVGSIVTDTRPGHGRKDSHFGDRSFNSILAQANATGVIGPASNDAGSAPPPKRGHGRKLSMLVEQPDAMKAGHRKIMSTSGELAAVLDGDIGKEVSRSNRRPGSTIADLARAGVLDSLREDQPTPPPVNAPPKHGRKASHFADRSFSALVGQGGRGKAHIRKGSTVGTLNPAMLRGPPPPPPAALGGSHFRQRSFAALAAGQPPPPPGPPPLPPEARQSHFRQRSFSALVANQPPPPPGQPPPPGPPSAHGRKSSHFRQRSFAALMQQSQQNGGVAPPPQLHAQTHTSHFRARSFAHIAGGGQPMLTTQVSAHNRVMSSLGPAAVIEDEDDPDVEEGDDALGELPSQAHARPKRAHKRVMSSMGMADVLDDAEGEAEEVAPALTRKVERRHVEIRSGEEWDTEFRAMKCVCGHSPLTLYECDDLHPGADGVTCDKTGDVVWKWSYVWKCPTCGRELSAKAVAEENVISESELPQRSHRSVMNNTKSWTGVDITFDECDVRYLDKDQIGQRLKQEAARRIKLEQQIEYLKTTGETKKLHLTVLGSRKAHYAQKFAETAIAHEEIKTRYYGLKKQMDAIEARGAALKMKVLPIRQAQAASDQRFAHVMSGGPYIPPAPSQPMSFTAQMDLLAGGGPSYRSVGTAYGGGWSGTAAPRVGAPPGVRA